MALDAKSVTCLSNSSRYISSKSAGFVNNVDDVKLPPPPPPPPPQQQQQQQQDCYYQHHLKRCWIPLQSKR